MTKLSAINITKSYRSRTVVNQINLSISEGEIVGMLGPNGAGKTTSFYMIVGLIRPDSGQIELDGEDITYLPMHKRSRMGIGYLPQETSIFRKLSVKDNILSILELRKELDKEQRQQTLTDLLNEFHISHLKDAPAISLSGGEKRRVEIARALALDPKFILLDEPFAGIDPISIIDIKRIIKHLCNRKIGVLITDHNVRETLDICQRAYIVSEGTIIAHGTPADILKHDRVREVYLGEDFDM
jgi:lipopolysaccharide export system ATP-binding protein